MKQPWLTQVEPGFISQTHVQCGFLPTISSWKTGTKSTCESCEWTWVVAGALAALTRHKGEGQLLPLHTHTQTHTHRDTHTHTHTHTTSWWLRQPRGCCALPSLCVSPGPGHDLSVYCIFRPFKRENRAVCMSGPQAPGRGASDLQHLLKESSGMRRWA